MTRTIVAEDLGVVPYGVAHEMQQRLLDERSQGQREDALLLLEHPHVVTLGRGAKAAHILWSREQLEARGFETFEVGRGGDVTYHGPGQLVAYAIFDLKPDRCDVRRYVRDLEEIMIRLCADFGVEATRISGCNGAWVGDEKIGAVGVRISRWVTMHGIAFNVCPDLDAYACIVPCGIRNRGITSLEKELGRKIPMEQVKENAKRHFASVFEAGVRMAK